MELDEIDLNTIVMQPAEVDGVATMHYSALFEAMDADDPRFISMGSDSTYSKGLLAYFNGLYGNSTQPDDLAFIEVRARG